MTQSTRFGMVMGSLLIGLIFQGTAFAAPAINKPVRLDGWYTRLGFGLGRSISGGNQTVNLTSDIKGVYENANPDTAGFLVLGEGYRWNVSNHWQLGVDIQLNAIDYGQTDGTTYRQLEPVQINSDPLGYRYRANSYALFGNVDISWWRTDKSYITLSTAVGSALNRLSDYTEYTLPNSSAAPMPESFLDTTTNSFAYALGLSAGYAFNHHVAIEFGYRYINTGNANFSPPSGINNDLSVGTLSAHMLFMNLLFS